MFICTANLTDTIQPAFLDRMEVIRLSGYTEDEKVEIAKRHIVPKQLEEHGITPEHLVLTDKALRAIINGYTREAGLRNLEREIAVHRPQGGAQGGGGPAGHGQDHARARCSKYLGAPKILPDEILKKDAVGIATGLAWTATGGDVMFIEATRHEGQGPPHPHRLAGRRDEGVGPGRALLRAHAGAAVRHQARTSSPPTTSTCTCPRARSPRTAPRRASPWPPPCSRSSPTARCGARVAMTGEITLRGNVLPIGGLKEKILAARRAGITIVICPSSTRRSWTRSRPTSSAGWSSTSWTRWTRCCASPSSRRSSRARWRRGRRARPDVPGQAAHQAGDRLGDSSHVLFGYTARIPPRGVAATVLAERKVSLSMTCANRCRVYQLVDCCLPTC